MVIHIIRKPLSEGNVAGNVLKWGTGALNIGASRIQSDAPPKECKAPGWDAYNKTNAEQGYRPTDYHQGDAIYKPSSEGRWPANLILEHGTGCECVGTKKIKGSFARLDNKVALNRVYGVYNPKGVSGISGHCGPDGTETTTAWDCTEGCPVADLDEQSGILKSGAMDSIAREGRFGVYGHMTERRVQAQPSEGGASRFFKQVKS